MKPVWKKAMHPRIGEKKKKNNQFSNNLPNQNENVLYNPLNPDSRQNAINIV